MEEERFVPDVARRHTIPRRRCHVIYVPRASLNASFNILNVLKYICGDFLICEHEMCDFRRQGDALSDDYNPFNYTY